MPDALLDTTFFVDLHRGERGARRLWARIKGGTLSASFSTITAFELWIGKHVAGDEEDFYQALFYFLEEVELSRFAAMQAGAWLPPLPDEVSEELIRDALIAASAAERNEPIYTRNVRDFTRFYANVLRY